jgi:hypothetical protein
MNERKLEDRLFDAVWQRNEADVRLAISTALTLARREGALVGWNHARPLLTQGEQTNIRVLFAELFPLPTRTVRKLREEPDPEDTGMLFRYNPEAPYDKSNGISGYVELLRNGHWFSVDVTPTFRRVSLWYDLMLRPWNEESVPVNPAEVLPP